MKQPPTIPFPAIATRADTGQVPEGSLRVGPLMAWPRVLEALGVDADALLAEFGLARPVFEDPENILSFEVLGAMLQRGAEVSGCDHLGVLLGRDASLSSLGVVGFQMLSSPTVGAALQELARHVRFHDRGAVIDLGKEGALATLAYTVTAPRVAALDQVYSVALMVGINIMRKLCGKGWRAVEVRLPFPRPKKPAPLREAFDAPPRFDAGQAAIVFPAGCLDQPLATADPLLHRMMSARIRQLTADAPRGLVEQVRLLLQTLVFLENCTPELVAGRLGLSVRTLNRRLAAEGTSVQRLREQARFETARQLLSNTAQPAGEIALMLGYSDASAFTRAFRRWAGMGPARWRAMAGGRYSPARTPPGPL